MLKRWFGRRGVGSGGETKAFAPAAAPEAKASRTGGLVALSSPGRPVWTPRDYAALAREGFGRNPVVHRCVRMIAEAAASVPWLAYEGEREASQHPMLSVLAQPNPRVAGRSLMEAVYGHLLVAGNAYLEAVAVDGAVRELHALRPDRMRVVPGADGWPEAYEYTVGGRTVRFPGEAPGGEGRLGSGASSGYGEGGASSGGSGAAAGGDGGTAGGGRAIRPILHLSLFHPLDDHYGFAPIEAAQTSLDVHNAAGAWTKALLDNSARPSGALVYGGGEGGNLSEEQFERLKRELEDGFSGARNAGRPLVLDGGLDWKAIGLSPKEMDFAEAKNTAAREIALAFGVPPMLLGIPGDNTFANYQEAHRALWRLAVLPLVGRTAEALGGWLSPAFGDGLRLGFDVDAIEALSTEREALWARVGAAAFLSDDEKRIAVGYGARS
jgi:phage portal protein BeeE